MVKIIFSRLPGILAVLAVFSLACGLSSNSPTSSLPPPTPLVVTVVVTATLEKPTEAPPPTTEPSQTPVPPTPIPTVIPTLSPTDTPLPVKTPTLSGPSVYIVQEGDTLVGIAQKLGIDLATLLAINPGIDTTPIKIGDKIIIPAPNTAFAPVGFIADTHDGVGLKFFNLDGSLISELVAPGLSEVDSQRVHIAGPWKGDLSTVPVVYYSTQGPGDDKRVDWLRIVEGSSTPLWVNVSQFFALAGAPAQPVLAYSTLDFEASQPRSRLYAADLQTLPGASPLFVIADPDGYMVRPLAVDAEAGKLKGIWYTMSAWGIGGDIVFEPRKGMKYLDMTSGMVNEILNRDMAAWDVSLDRNWVSYSTMSGPISVLNRRTGETYTFPLLPDSNRGAGDARISPDGQYVAWMEGSGWTMAENPDFHSSIRIATTAGVHLADIPQTAFDNVASSEKITWVEPVGWLDGQTLIVQVRFQDWNNAALIRINYDGSNPLYLATGTFVAFLYP